MRDEMEARLWAEHGEEFTTAMWTWIEALSAAFMRMHQRRYEAPWHEGEPLGCG